MLRGSTHVPCRMIGQCRPEPLEEIRAELLFEERQDGKERERNKDADIVGYLPHTMASASSVKETSLFSTSCLIASIASPSTSRVT